MMFKTILEHMFNFWILIHKKFEHVHYALKRGCALWILYPQMGLCQKKNTKMFYHVWLAKFSWFLFFFLIYWLHVLNFSLKSNLPVTPLIFGTTWAHVIEHLIKFGPFSHIRNFHPHNFLLLRLKCE